MGVTSGKDFFSSKWITAMIVDQENRMHLVPIKYTLSDDYFLATINKQLYAFKIVPNRIMIWYATLTKSFRVLWYTTAHYMPVSAHDNKELEMILEKNSLPKMNKLQFAILQQLGKREKNPKPGENFAPYKLVELVKEINKHPERNTEKIQNIRTYLEELDTDQIVTPVRHISDFIYEDLVETDANFLATVPEAMMKAEEENRKVTNSPIGAKRAWLKWVIVFVFVGITIGMIAFLFTSDTIQLPQIGQMSSPFQFGGSTANDLMKQYPNPESLKIACDNHQLDCNTLPPEVKKMLDAYKPPTVTPKSNTINLTP